METETVRHFDQVEFLHVVDILHAVTGVGAHVRFVRFLGAQMQEVVLLNQLLQLERQKGEEIEKIKNERIDEPEVEYRRSYSMRIRIRLT